MSREDCLFQSVKEARGGKRHTFLLILLIAAIELIKSIVIHAKWIITSEKGLCSNVTHASVMLEVTRGHWYTIYYTILPLETKSTVRWWIILTMTRRDETSCQIVLLLLGNHLRFYSFDWMWNRKGASNIPPEKIQLGKKNAVNYNSYLMWWCGLYLVDLCIIRPSVVWDGHIWPRCPYVFPQLMGAHNCLECFCMLYCYSFTSPELRDPKMFQLEHTTVHKSSCRNTSCEG